MEYKVGDVVKVLFGGKYHEVEIEKVYLGIGSYFYDGIRIFDKKEVSFDEMFIKNKVEIKKEENKYLKTWEAIKALEEGYNVKHKDWIHNQYIYKNKEGQIISNRVGPVEIDNLDNEWLIYEEPKKEIPKEFEGLKYILGSINNMDCGEKDCDKCPLGIEKCDMLDEIFFDMKEKYNF